MRTTYRPNVETFLKSVIELPENSTHLYCRDQCANLSIMKNYLFFVLLYSLSGTLTAQTDPFFRYALDTDRCYTKTDYPSLEAATQQLVADLLGFSPCYNNCALEQATACVPQLSNPEDALEESAGTWCFYDLVEVAWQCTAAPTEETPPGGEPAAGGAYDSAYFVKAGPNPFSQQVHFEITIENAGTPLLLRIVDWTGEIYFETRHAPDGHHWFVSADLGSRAPIGNYVALLEIDGQIVDREALQLLR